ncbi:MAG TPA: hypothetical protein VD948_03615 [Rhodothermales bacterium]|nr:hypothetical protein [Rhodothermales bacterium]
MLCLHPDLFVVVEQLEGERVPLPRPLSVGFTRGTAYRVLGLHTPSETSEAYFILANDCDEVCFVSSRHFRAHNLVPGATALRMPVRQREPAPASSGDGVSAWYEGDGAALNVPVAVLCDGHEHAHENGSDTRTVRVGGANAL